MLDTARTFWFGLVVALGLGAGGCSRPESPAQIAARQQILLLGNGADPKIIDPALAEMEIETIIDTALFEGLVNLANDGTTILPGVAERWEITPDGKTYTFHLRRNARWSDGTALTADDVVYSFRRLFTPALAASNNFFGFAITGAQAMTDGKGTELGVRAIDPQTLVIQLDYRCPYLLSLLAEPPMVPVPRATLERLGGGLRRDNPWTKRGNLVSNGAFMLKAWRPNQELVVVRNPYYWDAARVRLQEVHFYPTDDLDAEERAFRAGQLHVTYRLPGSKLAAYRQRRDPALQLTEQLSSYFLVLNTGTGLLRDERVRRALALAIDRNRIVPVVSQGGLSPGHSLTRPGTGGYQPPAVADFDPAKARQLLAEAGYPGGKGFPALGLRTTVGMTVSLAEALQESWRSVLGIRVEILPQESKTFFDVLRRHDYQIALMSFFYGINAPETMLVVGQSDSQWNFAAWKSPAFDRAYHEAEYSANDPVRFAACDRMEQAIFAEAPMVPLGFLNQPHLVSPMAKGWHDNVLYAIDWRELSLDPDAR